MIGWLIFTAYVAVWLLYGWRLTIHLLDAEVRRKLRQYPDLYNGADGAAEAADYWRAVYLTAGFGLALFWPVVAPPRFAYRMVSAKGLFRTPIEREEADRRELEVLRKQARELGLDVSGLDRPVRSP